MPIITFYCTRVPIVKQAKLGILQTMLRKCYIQERSAGGLEMGHMMFGQYVFGRNDENNYQLVPVIITCLTVFNCMLKGDGRTSRGDIPYMDIRSLYRILAI